MLPDPRPELLYVADPMCSWCWGFAPVLEALRERYTTRVDLRLILGGLRPGSAAEALDEHMKRHLKRHWSAVQEQTGQPFRWQVLEWEGFIYDTEPASRAVAIVRERDPMLGYGLFRAIQEAFYVGNEDVTRAEVLAALANGVASWDKDEFLGHYRSALSAELTSRDYRLARQLGVQGFPGLLLRTGRRCHTITQGYQPYSRLEVAMDAVLGQ